MAILVDPAKIVYVSAVAVRKVTVKVGTGKLSLPLDELEAAIVGVLARIGPPGIFSSFPTPQ